MDSRTIDALEQCAKGIRTLRELHGNDNEHLEAEANALLMFGTGLMSSLLGADGNAPVAQAKKPRKAKPAKADKPEAPKKAKTGRPRKEPPATEGGAKPERAARTATMGVCVICGQQYLRRSNVQKTCSPACLEKKRAGLDKDGNPLNEDGK